MFLHIITGNDLTMDGKQIVYHFLFTEEAVKKNREWIDTFNHSNSGWTWVSENPMPDSAVLEEGMEDVWFWKE
jgi:hypothetical protein